METSTIKHWKEVEETRQRGDRANSKMVDLNPTILITVHKQAKHSNQSADCQMGFFKKQDLLGVHSIFNINRERLKKRKRQQTKKIITKVVLSVSDKLHFQTENITRIKKVIS